MNARSPIPARQRTPMSDDQVKAFVQLQETRALRPEISAEQAQAIDYYYRRPYGNEEEGRSQAISSDVWDVVEGMTPSVVEPFVSSSDLVQFNAMGKEDEDAAQQESDYVNLVVTQRNDAFTQFVAWVKAGLLLKNGVVKYWWDKTRAVTIETYRGVTLDVLTVFLEDPDVEIIEATQNPAEDQPIADPGRVAYEAEQAEEAQEQQPQTQAQGQPPGQPGQPPIQQQPQAPDIEPDQPPPEGATFDIKIRRTSKEGYARYEVIPPEEFLIIGTSPNPQKASFVQHAPLKTISDLREMGYDVADDIADDSYDPTGDEVYAARHRAVDSSARAAYDGSGDPSMREVRFKESYCYIDADGDGIAELRKICMIGSTLIANDETEEICFAAWTPSQQLWQFDGRCPADEAIEVQDNKTTLLRQNSDNIFTINNNRVFAGPKVNLDDLLDNQIAGIVRTTGDTPMRDQVMSLPVQPLGAIIAPFIEYWDQIKENRTGFTRYNQGSSDSMGKDKTLGEVQIVAGAGSKRTGLTIRSLAEQGMKPLMLGIHRLCRRHATKADTIRLRGKWVTIDPRTWRLREDMTVSVGTGTMDKQQELTTQQEILKMQAGLAPSGIVTPENQYNAAAKFVELAGEKDTDKYFTHPDKMPAKTPPDPMQDPKVMIEVSKQQLERDKFQAETRQKDRELDQVDRELDQVDQKQGIESANAQLDALARQHELQLRTEAHRRDMAAPHAQALAAGNQALSAQQQGHQQAMDQVAVEPTQQALDIQASPPAPSQATAPAAPTPGA
jgi:hypothetical protein